MKTIRLEIYKGKKIFWMEDAALHKNGGPAYIDLQSGYHSWYYHGKFMKYQYGDDKVWNESD
jgi:hypothetical protein